MIPAHWRERLRRDGWILVALCACIVACQLMGAMPQSTTAEERISRVLSEMAGAGQTEIAIYYDAQNVPCGALVLSDGAEDVAVRLQVNRAVATLLGLEQDEVVVYPRKVSQDRSH